jgi:hypothetical protein
MTGWLTVVSTMAGTGGTVRDMAVAMIHKVVRMREVGSFIIIDDSTASNEWIEKLSL